MTAITNQGTVDGRLVENSKRIGANLKLSGRHSARQAIHTQETICTYVHTDT